MRNDKIDEEKAELISLLKKSFKINYHNLSSIDIKNIDYNKIADCLLERIIVLPYKIGTEVYEVCPKWVINKYGKEEKDYFILITKYFDGFSNKKNWTFLTMEEALSNIEQRKLHDKELHDKELY